MPLIRLQVRNEFCLGDPGLHRSAARDDPKAVLDGVAVSGLVGILRQLGDLTEFASEIFHDLHEQMTMTAVRSSRMLIRVKNIEAALPPIEKMVAGQNGHIHFAYTSGSDWHPKIQNEENYISHVDMPRFMLDSYEECGEPPRLFLLDKFDPAGSGACLRRYSDPSYFKSVWASSELIKAEQLQKEMKSLKSKKKQLRQRSGSVSCSGLMSRRYSSLRLQFPLLDSDGSIYTSNMRSKSELTNRHVSFDSKTWSGYSECDANVSSSTGREEREQSELSASGNKMNYTDNNASLPVEPPEMRGHDLPREPLEDPSSLRSSSVSCDEKKEIVEPSTQTCGNDLVDQVAAELVPMPIGLSKIVVPTAELGHKDQNDIIFDITKVAEHFPGMDHFNEVISETDNFMDALNTMESESETDVECQTKRELELRCNFKHGLENATSYTNGKACRTADDLKLDSPVSSHSSLTDEMSPKASSIGPSESRVNMEVSQSAQLPRNDHPRSIDDQQSNAFDTTVTESSPTIGRSSSRSEVSDMQVESMVDLRRAKSSPKASDIPPITIWTNGGILGLQPSKPSDLNVSSAIKKDHVDLENDFMDTKIQRDEESTLNVISYINDPPRELHQKNNVVEDPYGISGNRDRYLRDACKRKASIQQVNEYEASRVDNSNLVSDRNRPQNLDIKKGPKGHAFKASLDIDLKESVPAGSTSPPLEHMKISFHPIDTSNTSKLKLEFPRGHQFLASTQEVIFPSFQLLHEPSPPVQDIISESEDDTFCKSSTYMSEDPLSPRSESNSEQWESGETNGSGDYDMYDALCRVHSNASSCSSLDFVPVTSSLTHQSQDHGSLNQDNGNSSLRFDLMSSTTNPQNVENHTELKEGAHLAIDYPNEMPPPPPLPPLQWRIMKPAQLVLENKPKNILDSTHQTTEKKVVGPTQKQLTAEVPKLPDIKEAPAFRKKIMFGQHQRHQDVNKAVDGTGVGEREDFLHQIRTKSFSLRPTVTSKQNPAAGGTANVNVVAILEKANAIRQAVGSDDGGDDDNWSDT